MKLWGNWSDMVIDSTRIPKGFSTTGEWLGQERYGERNQHNDPVVALAVFVAGTITEGCPCDSCEHRRYLVHQLVYGWRIDDKVLNDVIFSAPLPGKTPRRKNGTGPWSKKAPAWMNKDKPRQGKI